MGSLGAPSHTNQHPYNQVYMKEFAIDEVYQRIYSVQGYPYGVQLTDMNTRSYGTIWPFGAPYGADVVVEPNSPFVYGASAGPYDGRIRRFRRSDGMPLGDYLVGPVVHGQVEITGNGHLMFLTGIYQTPQLGIIGCPSLVIGVPVARFSDDSPAKPGVAVTFDATATTDDDDDPALLDYQWDFGDSTTDSGQVVQHTFLSHGQYEVRLTVTDGDGYQDTVTSTVSITHAPVAEDQAVAAVEDTPRLIVLQASDPDDDPLVYRVETQPASGSVTITDDVAEYTPNANFAGDDSFTFVASDGMLDSNAATVSITISPTPDPPIAVDDAYETTEDVVLTVPADGVLGNDWDDDGDPITAELGGDVAHGTLDLQPDGSFVYTPDPGYYGADSFTYTAYDGAAHSNEVTVTITVYSLLGRPVAIDDSYEVQEDDTLNVDLPSFSPTDILVNSGSKIERYDGFTGEYQATLVS